MVERLRAAIEKARGSREAGVSGAVGAASGPASVDGAVAAGAHLGASEADHASSERRERWLALPELRLSEDALVRERIISLGRADRAHFAFDALRTRLLTMLRDNGWSRVAVTSPTKGCGKTTIATNLAFSLARQPEIRSVLIDLDLRMPQLANRLGVREDHRIKPFLTGGMPAEAYLRRFGENLAFGLNSSPVRNSAELVQSRLAAQSISAISAAYQPDVMLFDMPPMLTCDDVLGFLPNVDGVLLVIGGGETKPGAIDECEQLIESHSNFLGIILNKGEGLDINAGYYGYGSGDGHGIA
ncbi:MAG TPA: CpsD/CapB family tyrosine-protein kinase [Paracoccaceae bacterium]|nr:CpsD/CapB family tyrosine-protein kinase [Paracoccaceae bacterium]